jgi:hypothetical protein
VGADWARRPGAGGGLIPLDVDATIVTSWSDKEQAALTWKEVRVPPADGARR